MDICEHTSVTLLLAMYMCVRNFNMHVITFLAFTIIMLSFLDCVCVSPAIYSLSVKYSISHLIWELHCVSLWQINSKFIRVPLSSLVACQRINSHADTMKWRKRRESQRKEANVAIWIIHCKLNHNTLDV